MLPDFGNRELVLDFDKAFTFADIVKDTP